MQCDLLIGGEEFLARAAKTDDGAMRLALGFIALIVPNQSLRLRQKKPFNPMLGETFEYVTEDFRFVVEKVAHRPNQVLAFCVDGKGYRLLSNNNMQGKFLLNGGKGELDITQWGCRDLYFRDYDEHISYGHFTLACKNIIYGGLYNDLKDQACGINHKTGEKVVIDFVEKVAGENESHIKGKVLDASGKPVLEIKGSWLDTISITHLDTGETEEVWTAPPLVPNAHLQYFFNETLIEMNYYCPEMKGVVAPTDSRYRPDVRLHEEGDLDEAEVKKCEIENRQRQVRKKEEANGLKPHPPRFFREKEHPFITS